MIKEQFITYLDSPDSLDNESLKELREMLEEFPYFQTARLLYVKNLKLMDDIKYENQLKLTAAYSTDRKILYNLVNKETGVSIPYIPIKEEIVFITDKPVLPEEEISQPVTQGKSEPEAMIQPVAETFPRPEKEEEPEPASAIPLNIEESVRVIKQETIETVAQTENSIADIILKRAREMKEARLDKEPVKPTISKKEEITVPEPEQPISAITGEVPKNEGMRLADIILKRINEIKKRTEESQAEELNNQILFEQPETQDEDQQVARIPSETEKPEPALREEIEPEIPQEAQSILQENGETAESVETFSDWLKISSHKKENLKSEQELIEEFILGEPRIAPVKDFKNTDSQTDISEESIEERDDYITETLAKIYIQQGLLTKSLQIYKKLHLISLEKSIYFANQIEKLEGQIKK